MTCNETSPLFCDECNEGYHLQEVDSNEEINYGICTPDPAGLADLIPESEESETME